MPRTSPLRLEQIADRSTLTLAFGRAARGRSGQRAVEAFRGDLEGSLRRLQEGLLSGDAPQGRFTRFEVHDPKRRTIEAPCFPDRVVHHAMMAHMAPFLDRTLVADTFACRPNKGTLAAVRRAQHHQQRWPFWVKVDVRSYFHSIDHDILLGLLSRRFRASDVITLCERVLSRREGALGVGLPIGSLCSQHFANLYLDGFDRFLLQTLRVPGMVRYMDDVIWWCHSREQARDTLAAAMGWVAGERLLQLKPNVRIGRGADPLPLCGFQVERGRLGLSRRRRRRLVAALRRAERAFRLGQIGALGLVSRADSALAIGAHADALGWRRRVLAARPTLEAK
jgi:RNA-directed DNA polymerase